MTLPFLKWVGSKRRLLPQLQPYLLRSSPMYCEPFLGSGSVFFNLQPAKAVLQDINPCLIATYLQIRDNFDGLSMELELLHNCHLVLNEPQRQTDYLAKREEFNCLPTTAQRRAALFIFLNRTCFNGVFRVNRQGKFNVGFGRYKKPKIYNPPTLQACHQILQNAELKVAPFDSLDLESFPKGSFFYLDPPYIPVSPTANFTNYSAGGFNLASQEKLARFCDRLDRKGMYFLLSNSDTEWCRQTYRHYNQTKVYRRGTINSDPTKRQKVTELLIYNYPVEDMAKVS